jgi:hypothetical protein
MLAHFLPALCASVLAAGGCQQDNPAGIRARPQADVVAPRVTSVMPIADTYVRQGSPNQNQGAELILRLQSSGKNRALLRWDQQMLTQAVGGGTLAAAHLELTIADLGDNWSAAGRTVDLHRLTHAWTELGATWNCSDDTLPANSRPDCAGATAWDMDHSASYPWVATPTATALLRNGQTGVVAFDVTADVQAWLAGQQQNFGWILKKTVEGDPGKVDFGSRESGAAPRLVLSLVAGDTTVPPIPVGFRLPRDSTRLVADRTDTSIVYFRDIFAISFHDSTSGRTIRAVLARYEAQIIGGMQWTRSYVIRVRDPGSSSEAFDSLTAGLSREPGVEFAAPLTFRPGRPVIHGRYPNDGAGAHRESWFGAASGSGTWSRLAIRAPLAWGCETGLYGGPRVRIGMADFFFDSLHPDLRPNIASVTALPDSEDVVHDDSLLSARFLSHGTAVAGVVAALADNGRGVAGVLWGADLYLYALARRDSLPRDPVVYLAASVLPRAASQGVRVLVSASDFSVGRGPQAGERVKMLDKALQSYVSSGAGNLFVFSAGNDTTRVPVSDFANGGVPHVTAVQTAVARIVARSDADRNRVFVVAGTDRGNVLRDLSNFFVGGTDIAAPAREVLTLAHTSYDADGVQVLGGTSIAAPFVAGVAGLLWAMDPSLPADSVKDYILRGAQASRLNSTTGQMVDPQPVQGAPGTVYQLDAYGALTLLSSERAGTPICGFPVSVSADQSAVVLERPGGPVTLTVPGQWIGAFSVAQGGRLISVFNADMETGAGRSVIVDQTGRVRALVPDTLRTFLERDTLDAAWNSLGTLVHTLRPGSGGSSWDVRPLERLGYQPEVCDFGGYYALAFSPSGESVAVTVKRCALPGRPVELWMVPTDIGASPQLVKAFPPVEVSDEFGLVSWDVPWDVGWSHDSRRVIYFTQRQREWVQPGTTLIVSSVGADGVPHDVMVPETTLWSHAFTPDDAAVVTIEEPGPFLVGPCAESRRDPATWAVLAGPRDVGSCVNSNGYSGYRRFPNAPPARASVASAAPASSMLQMRSTRGFGLSAPVVALERQMVGVGSFHRALRVQVN